MLFLWIHSVPDVCNLWIVWYFKWYANRIMWRHLEWNQVVIFLFTLLIRYLRCWSILEITSSSTLPRTQERWQPYEAHFPSSPCFTCDLSLSRPITRKHDQLFHQQLQPLGCNLINVASDHHGMIPADLRKLLARWDPADTQKPGSTAPRVLYTIPNGGNPTGASMTSERKQEVYEVSRVYSSVHTFDLQRSVLRLSVA